MKFLLLSQAVGLTVMVLACSPDHPKLVKLDLHPHGLPITIMAPDSAEVRFRDYSAMKDYTIRKGDDFFIQIFEIHAPRIDAAGEKLRQLEMVRRDPFFKELILEDDHGFIFNRQADSLTVDHDFRFIRIIDGRELIFQTGLVGTFSKEDVYRMYNAIR